MTPDFAARAKELENEIIALRRHFHSYPELSFCEYETTKYIAERLTEIGCENVRIGAYGRPTGVMAEITGAFPGKRVALRADIDGLPVTEETGAPFASKNVGAMHACGHDSHIAVLLGAAKMLYEVKDRLHGSVRLIFQPAEETAGLTVGAVAMIDAGALDDVDAIFGIHVWTPVQSGKFAWTPGPLMACCDEWKVTLRGKGGHGASPHETHDPMTAAGQLICALQTFVSRELDPLKSAVLTIGMLKAGTAFNIIPGEVELTGTARAFETQVSDDIEAFIRRMAENIAAAFRCTAEVVYDHNLPPTVNDPAMAEFGATCAREIFGDENVYVTQPTMAGEDFSYYLLKKPGAFFFVGVGDEKLGTTWPHHHCKFSIDESQLCKASAFEALTAWKFLSR